MIKSRIGAHVSTAGGVFNAPERAKNEGCETFQCFSRSPQGGPAPKLTSELLKQFKTAMTEQEIETFYIHAPYYINFASLEPRIRRSSIAVIKEELERGSALGARYIMAHVGSHTGQTAEQGIASVIKGLTEVLKDYSGTTQFLIEISAGAGNVLTDTFEETAEIVGPLKKFSGFGGVCFDTCHAFASGYDFRTPAGAKKVLKEFDAAIGLEWLKLTHVNDSKMDLGGKRDRHEHIGAGFIGQEGLASILTTPAFSKIDWILETETEDRLEDIKKLKTIRGK